uniref:Uncharacterized protein n=1 Tax=Rhinopithecus roxellana TaxID=61622 RepID=A0A2K6NXX1_RHIRO
MDHRGLLSPFYLPFSAKNKVGAPQPGCQALHPFTDVFIQQASASRLSGGKVGGRAGPGARGRLLSHGELAHFPWSQQLGFRCQQMVTEVPCSLEVWAPAQLHTCLGPASRIS